MPGKVHVRKGDTVKVIAGNERGKTGRVLRVIPSENRVVVEGLNIRKKHARPTRTDPQGGIVEIPGPIHASNVQLVCPSCNRATRIKRERGQDGKVNRICKHCGKSAD
ncbi:MAG: 50S ribosomal protein L24 [Firmicutes bacterium]|nr:50S ribosomal protein L24 [Bacillota bacterium]